jgi:thioredoxin-related protein
MVSIARIYERTRQVKFRQAMFAIAFSFILIAPAHSEPSQHIVGASGLPSLSWFKETSSDLRDDLMAAKKSGKLLVLVWEQAGCYYCKQMRV